MPAGIAAQKIVARAEPHLQNKFQVAFGPEAPVRIDGLVREQEFAALAAPDHPLDAIEQHSGGDVGIAEFARALKVIPGDLNRILDQYRQRLIHTKNNAVSGRPFLLIAQRAEGPSVSREAV